LAFRRRSCDSDLPWSSLSLTRHFSSRRMYRLSPRGAISSPALLRPLGQEIVRLGNTLHEMLCFWIRQLIRKRASFFGAEFPMLWIFEQI
jgi:hypothetical protein